MGHAKPSMQSFPLARAGALALPDHYPSLGRPSAHAASLGVPERFLGKRPYAFGACSRVFARFPDGPGGVHKSRMVYEVDDPMSYTSLREDDASPRPLLLPRAARDNSRQCHLRAQHWRNFHAFIYLCVFIVVMAPALAAVVPQLPDNQGSSLEHETKAQDVGSTATWTDSEWVWHIGVLLTVFLWTLFARWMESYEYGSYEYWWAIASLSLTLFYGFLAFGEGSRWGAASVAIASSVFLGLLVERIARRHDTGLLMVLSLFFSTIAIDVVTLRSIDCDNLFDLGTTNDPLLFITIFQPSLVFTTFLVWSFLEILRSLRTSKNPTGIENATEAQTPRGQE